MVNNAISLVYPSNDLPLHTINDHKLKVVYRGNDLGDEYAISFKKIVQGEELKENIKLKDKYLWTPLKVKDGNGEETWVKILKSDLKQTFQIEDDDLLGVKDIEGLESLIGVHLNKILDEFDSEKKVSENNSLYRSIVKFFLCHFVVYPTAKRTVQKAIENKTPEQLADIYVKDTESLLATVTGRLQKKHESALEFFGSEMISQIIDEALITEANKQLKKQKEAPWDDNKLALLNQLRVVNYFANNPDELTNKEQLDKINIMMVPLAKLAEIHATDKNLKVLKEVWKEVTDNLYAKGNLDLLSVVKDERENIIKSDSAGLYAEAYYLMPDDVRDGLEFKKDKTEQIKRFALQHSMLDKEGFKVEQKIYLEKIQPLIKEKLEKYISSTSVSNLLKLYTRVSGNRYDVQNIAADIYSALSADERKLFSRNIREALVFHEIEKIAVLQYSLTSTQLNSLTEYKDAYSKKMDEYRSFSDKISDAESEEEIFDVLNFSSLMDSDEKELENILPSRFPQLEEGYTTSPLVDLDRMLAAKRLKRAGKKINSLQKLDSDDLKSIEDSIKLGDHRLKLEEEITLARNYLSAIDKRDKKYLKYNGYFKLGNDHISKMLNSEEVKQDILNGQSSQLFSPAQQLNLMDLEDELNTAKLNSIFTVREIDHNILKSPNATRSKIAEFLDNARNDAEFIKSLNSCRPSTESNATKNPLNKLPVGISEDTVDFVLEYVLRTKKMEELTKPLDKVLFKTEHLLEIYKKDPSSIDKDERLTLKELGILSSAERLSTKRYIGKGDNWDFTQELKSLGLVDVSWKLGDFAKKTEQTKVILKEFNRIAQKSINRHYDAGDIFAYNGVKKEKWQDKPSDTMQKLTMFVANDLTHGGKLYRKNNEIQASHLLGGVVNREFNFYEICVSDVWKMDLAPLVPKNMEGNLEMILGDDWTDEINKMYKSIENGLQLNSKRKFKNVDNDAERRNLAGVANYGSFLKFIHKDLKGHERDFDRDFNKLHDKFFNDKKFVEKQICSEFASKITLVSIIELNRRLSKDLLEKLDDKFDSKKILDQMRGEGKEISQDLEDYANGVRHFRTSNKIKNESENEVKNKNKSEKGTKTKSRDVQILNKPQEKPVALIEEVKVTKEDRNKWKTTIEAEKQWKEILKERGYTASEIDLVIRLGNKEVLDLPYSKRERLRAIHPGRMASLLVEKGCATKRELPPVMQALFDIDPYMPDTLKPVENAFMKEAQALHELLADAPTTEQLLKHLEDKGIFELEFATAFGSEKAKPSKEQYHTWAKKQVEANILLLKKGAL